MYKISIYGGRPLSGSLRVQGAKNSVLPILAATILCDGECTIEGCPDLRDVNSAINILEYIGCKIKREGDTITVNSENVKNDHVPDCLMAQMRSSITFLGALTARCGKARMSSPGGCELGPRPIDLHIKALRKLGVKIEEKAGFTETEAGILKGASIHLDFPSVGATENAMIAAVLAEGTTTIENAAREPEILDLECFLCKMGARVSGAGTGTITIEGVKRLEGTYHKVIPDRIVAATYLCAAMLSGGEIELTDINPENLNAVTFVLRDVGAEITTAKDRIYLKAPKRLRAIDILRTMPYPGFPTDAQAQTVAMLAIADGTSIVEENIFENRFKYCGELCKMGADIHIKGRTAVIRGVIALEGTNVSAAELRGGAALVIAGVAAHGTTIVSGTDYIERGYTDLVGDLKCLGADIKRI